jgi:hypothetical protein
LFQNLHLSHNLGERVGISKSVINTLDGDHLFSLSVFGSHDHTKAALGDKA